MGTQQFQVYADTSTEALNHSREPQMVRRPSYKQRTDLTREPPAYVDSPFPSYGLHDRPKFRLRPVDSPYIRDEFVIDAMPLTRMGQNAVELLHARGLIGTPSTLEASYFLTEPPMALAARLEAAFIPGSSLLRGVRRFARDVMIGVAPDSLRPMSYRKHVDRTIPRDSFQASPAQLVLRTLESARSDHLHDVVRDFADLVTANMLVGATLDPDLLRHSHYWRAHLDPSTMASYLLNYLHLSSRGDWRPISLWTEQLPAATVDELMTRIAQDGFRADRLTSFADNEYSPYGVLAFSGRTPCPLPRTFDQLRTIVEGRWSAETATTIASTITSGLLVHLSIGHLRSKDSSGVGQHSHALRNAEAEITRVVQSLRRHGPGWFGRHSHQLRKSHVAYLDRMAHVRPWTWPAEYLKDMPGPGLLVDLQLEQAFPLPRR